MSSIRSTVELTTARPHSPPATPQFPPAVSSRKAGYQSAVRVGPELRCVKVVLTVNLEVAPRAISCADKQLSAPAPPNQLSVL